MTAAPQTLGIDPELLALLQSLGFKARFLMAGYLSGQHRSPFHGFSVEFNDYRRYQPGDDLRYLDWRLYARSDRLCVKRYVQETNARVYLLCDTSASMQYRGSAAWGSKIECAKALAAALTWSLLKRQDAAGLLTSNGAEFPVELLRPSQQPSQLGLVLRQLTSLSPAGGTCLARLLREAARLVHRRSIILLLSDLLDPAEELSLAFKYLRFLGHEVIVVQILDPDEIEFPFSEGRIFEDLETGERRRIHAAARGRYLERFKVFMAAHEQLFQELEISHCLVRTDQDAGAALARFLAQRSRRF